MKGLLAMLYRAVRPLGLWPHEVDEMELWQIGVLLDGDIGPPPPRLTFDPPPPDSTASGPVLLEVD